jgi:hypothetical protein
MAKRSKSRSMIDGDKVQEEVVGKVILLTPDSLEACPPSLATPELFPAKKRCAGAVRSGEACRYWAMAESDFCYWCQQANAPRYPLPKTDSLKSLPSGKREIHKRRCAGVTVFGDPCRFFAVGTSDYCLWCQRSMPQKPELPRA